MNFKKHSTLIIGCGIALVLLIVAAFFLIKNQGSYRDNVRSLQSAKNRLNSLNTRNPFPSQENVALAAKNLDTVTSTFKAALDTLRRDQLQSVHIESARFAPMLEETSRRIRGLAAETGVSLPTELGLGFKDYAAGKLPPNDTNVMDRLVIQLKAVEDLSLIMLDAKVQSIDTIQRDEFELRTAAVPDAQPDVRTRGRGPQASRQPVQAVRAMLGGIPLPESNDLYSTERIIFTFTARESAVWEVLSRLVNSKVFYVISDVSFENTRTDLGKPVDMKAKLATMTAAARASQTGAMAMSAAPPQLSLESITREERVVGGREPIKARIVVDMYRFHDPAQEEGQP